MNRVTLILAFAVVVLCSFGPSHLLAQNHTKTAANTEARLWANAESSGSLERYQYYLDTFPNGVCASLAESRVKEAQAWERVKGSYNAMVIESYLRTNLPTRFAEVALEKLRHTLLVLPSDSGTKAAATAFTILNIRSKLPPLEECEVISNSEWQEIRDRIVEEAEPLEVEASKATDSLGIWKVQCEELGFVTGTERFGECVLLLMGSGPSVAALEVDSSLKEVDASVPLLGQRLALVVGNGLYDDRPLDNPVNDSLLISKVLQELGFVVTLVQDVTQVEMKQAIVNFGMHLEESGSDAVGLFYFAGHGVQVRGNNYLIPVGGPYIGRAADVDVFAVDANEVLDQMHFAGNAMNIVILDACRNNPYFRRFRGTPVRGLARMDAPRGTIIAYSTRPGDLAADGLGNYSPYTEALVRAMRIPGLSLSEVFIRTRRDVMEATRAQQVPWEEGGLTANFYFIPLEQSSTETN